MSPYARGRALGIVLRAVSKTRSTEFEQVDGVFCCGRSVVRCPSSVSRIASGWSHSQGCSAPEGSDSRLPSPGRLPRSRFRRSRPRCRRCRHAGAGADCYRSAPDAAGAGTHADRARAAAHGLSARRIGADVAVGSRSSYLAARRSSRRFAYRQRSAARLRRHRPWRRLWPGPWPAVARLPRSPAARRDDDGDPGDERPGAERRGQDRLPPPAPRARCRHRARPAP